MPNSNTRIHFRFEKTIPAFRHVTSEFVSISEFDGREILKVDPQALVTLANEAMRDVSFLLRTRHLKKVAAILKDPEASDNDRTLPWQCCATPTLRRKAFCRSVRTPARRRSSARRVSRFGPASKTKSIFRGSLQNLHRRKSALLANRAAQHVRGSRHRDEFAGQSI